MRGIEAPLINAPVYLDSAFHYISELWVNLNIDKTKIVVETFSSKDSKKNGESPIHRRAYYAPVNIDSIAEAYRFLSKQEEFSSPEKEGGSLDRSGESKGAS